MTGRKSRALMVFHWSLISLTGLLEFLMTSRLSIPSSHRPALMRWWSMAAFIISSAAVVQPSAWFSRALSSR